MKWKPRHYQREGAKFIVSRPAAGLFWDPGLGKTTTTLAGFSILQKKRLVDSMLIVAPLRVATDVWPDEVEKWDDFSHLSIGLLHGPKKEHVLAEDHDIYVINYEGLPWLAEQDWAYPPMVVFDESTKIKHTTTQRYRLLRQMLPYFERRYILTGTPAPNGLLDLFGQILALDGGEALGRYITHYKLKYFYQSGYGGFDWLPLPGAEEEIYGRLAPLVSRLDEKDYLELPALFEAPVYVDLPPKARRAYNEMEKAFITELREGVVSATNAGAKTAKLRQLAAGAVYVDDSKTRGKRRVSQVHNAKIEALEDIVEELSGQPTMVAYAFRHDLDRLQKKFPKAPRLGGSSTKAISRTKALWNQGAIPVMFTHPESAGHGLNLQFGGSNLTWFSSTYNLELDHQTLKRLLRSGQRNNVFVRRIIAKNTIDEAIEAARARKDRTQKSLLNALKDYYGVRRRAA